jgi:hypothetical protein
MAMPTPADTDQIRTTGRRFEHAIASCDRAYALRVNAYKFLTTKNVMIDISGDPHDIFSTRM